MKFCSIFAWYVVKLSGILWYHDVGVKSPQLWCLRIVPCIALPQSSPVFAYRGIIIPLLCLRSASVGAKRTSTGCSAPYRGGSLSHKTTLVQAHRGFRLLTLASLYSIRNDANESLCYRKSNSFRLGITKIYLLFYHKIVNFANKKTIHNGYGMYKKSIAGK